MKRVLVTGFDPFDNEPVNAAWEVVKELGGLTTENAKVVVRQIPTVFGESISTLYTAIDEVNPDIVICVGQAGGRSAVSVERIGVNLSDARIPDNRGVSPVQEPIVPGGPDGYFSTLPVRAIVEAVREAGIPAEESWSAGTYVCNHLLYGLMHRLQDEIWSERGVLGGFIHIPFLPEQAVRHKNAPSLPADLVRQAIEIAVGVACPIEMR
ncbi:pyroglutamyl-peptidase I [Alicyclobacillus mengziensis]|uniref:Pyrrolidone-carboxylate peptidase n=1 Tax=Alicyclobacillus mengziensis TaxID=2931921 RepID=A0A9X7Z4Q4_9BACL|nr:pyroglutamyl-peptidase I [Alicyclobacillus mengziensis]QSO46189.1 pyroglutamyl-peptidase I [Alicyclobacillus mengziensis]